MVLSFASIDRFQAPAGAAILGRAFRPHHSKTASCSGLKIMGWLPREMLHFFPGTATLPSKFADFACRSRFLF